MKVNRSVFHATPSNEKEIKRPRRQGDELSPDSFQSPAVTPSQVPLSQEGTTYANRQGKGTMVMGLNENGVKRDGFEPSTRGPLGQRVDISTVNEDFDNIDQRYRFMYTSLDERARALDRQLLRLQKAMCEKIGLDEEELQPVGVPSQSTVWVCGRVCCEEALGKINKATIVLEGSRVFSGGRRVQLDVSKMQAFSLFPGQILLVEGVNSHGRSMVASRIVDGACSAPPKSNPKQLLEYHHSTSYQNGQPVSAVVAAGPFTTSENLEYEPIMTLLAQMLSKKPDVLILIGPFVDITQPLLSSGDVRLLDKDNDGDVIGEHVASYEMVFTERIIRDGFGSYFNSEEDAGGLPTNIVMIPSLNDAHHEHVFPQPPFGDRDRVDTSYFKEPLGMLNIPHMQEADPKKRVHLMPNPCMFRVNEMVFAATSQDVLCSLSMEEMSAGIMDHRMTRMMNHMMLQQSFFPQFPPPPSLGAQLDMRQSKHWQMKVTPDVLIVPSKLSYLARESHGALVLNPGHLAKGASGGTYAELHVACMKEADLQAASDKGEESVKHNVPARASVMIAKI
jgi:DNA polymerase alpha subunit B